MRTAIPGRAALALAAIGACAPGADAQVSASNTLLLYNSRNAESAAVHAWYVAAHPGVRSFDIDLEYPTFGYYETLPSEPNAEGINNRYITRAMFGEIFQAPDARFAQYLAVNPDIACIATTRGLPVSVSDDFNPAPYSFPPRSAGSVEAWLSRLRVPGDIGARALNPYFGAIDKPFVREQNAGVYLVCRLDASGASSEASLEAVRAMIERSATLRADKFDGAILLDSDGSAREYVWQSDNLGKRPLSSELTEAPVLLGKYERFQVVADRSREFYNGPDDPAYNPDTDGALIGGRSLLALKTLGRNHTSAIEPIPFDYASGLRPTPASLFVPVESYSAWALHDPDNGAGQGQCGVWIARGGGFSAGFTDEPYSVAGLPQMAITSLNLYVYGRPWAEAAYAGIAELGKYTVLLGDPLAQVVLIDPDVDKDGVVTSLDAELVSGARAAQDLRFDIDKDGDVGAQDLSLVLDRMGRSNPVVGGDDAYWPVRGDTNYDLAINGADLARLLSLWGARGAKARPVDLNKDGAVDAADIAVLLSDWSLNLRDVDGDGAVTDADKQAVLAAIGASLGEPGYVRTADVNCDGRIDFDDWSLLWR